MLKYPGQLVVEDGNYRALLNLSFATFKKFFLKITFSSHFC